MVPCAKRVAALDAVSRVWRDVRIALAVLLLPDEDEEEEDGADDGLDRQTVLRRTYEQCAAAGMCPCERHRELAADVLTGLERAGYIPVPTKAPRDAN